MHIQFDLVALLRGESGGGRLLQCRTNQSHCKYHPLLELLGVFYQEQCTVGGRVTRMHDFVDNMDS